MYKTSVSMELQLRRLPGMSDSTLPENRGLQEELSRAMNTVVSEEELAASDSELGSYRGLVENHGACRQ